MGKSILTTKQLDFLELVSNEKQITKRFYFTGGTALAEFYLQHRLSEDIDLFTEKEEVNQVLIDPFLKKISPKLSIVEIKKSQFVKVKEISDLPTMLVPFNQKDMEKFFLDLAKSLESGIFK